MRLQTFAYYIQLIMVETVPFVVWFNGKRHEVAFKPRDQDVFPDPIWDTVLINGYSCGNRSGGRTYLTDLFCLSGETLELGVDTTPVSRHPLMGEPEGLAYTTSTGSVTGI